MISKRRRKTNAHLLEMIRDLPCCVCGAWPVDASHIRTRGAGGPDAPFNVVAHCRKHHTEWGMSWSKFLAKYPPMAFKLRALGWTWESGKLWHKNLGA